MQNTFFMRLKLYISSRAHRITLSVASLGILLFPVPYSLANTAFDTSFDKLPSSYDIHYQSPYYTIQTGDTLSRIARDWGRSTGQSSRQLTHKVTLWLRDNNYDAFSNIDGSELIVGNVLYLPTPEDIGVSVQTIDNRATAEDKPIQAAQTEQSHKL